jgi:hypothetical protein
VPHINDAFNYPEALVGKACRVKMEGGDDAWVLLAATIVGIVSTPYETRVELGFGGYVLAGKKKDESWKLLREGRPAAGAMTECTFT